MKSQNESRSSPSPRGGHALLRRFRGDTVGAVAVIVALATIPAVLITGAVFLAILVGIYQVGKNVDETFQALVEIGG